MLKETIICIVIVIAIFFGNSVTQNYTKESVSELSNSLTALREQIAKDEIETQKINEEIDNFSKKWEERHEKLSYYIEHNELEKIETSLTQMKSFIETGEYGDSISELDTSAFLIRHIEDRYAFNLENIF